MVIPKSKILFYERQKERRRGKERLHIEKIMIQYFSCMNHQSNHRVIFLVSNMLLHMNSIRNLYVYSHYLKKRCTITEKSAVAFSLGGDNLKRYFDQR